MAALSELVSTLSLLANLHSGDHDSILLKRNKAFHERYLHSRFVSKVAREVELIIEHVGNFAAIFPHDQTGVVVPVVILNHPNI